MSLRQMSLVVLLRLLLVVSKCMSWSCLVIAASLVFVLSRHVLSATATLRDCASVVTDVALLVFGYVLWGQRGLLLMPTLVGALPISEEGRVVTLLVKIMPFSIPERAVADKMSAIVDIMTPDEAKHIRARERTTIYRHYWNGSSRQQRILLQVARLSDDEDALPYLRRILQCTDADPELKSDARNVADELSMHWEKG